MRVRRSVVVAAAFAASLGAGLALAGSGSSHIVRAAATTQAFVAEHALVAAPAGRIARAWTDRHGDERQAQATPDAVLPLAGALQLAGAGILVTALWLVAREQRIGRVHVRGPPRLQLV